MERAINQYFEGAPDATYLEPFLRSAAEWADRHGIGRERLILGEFGALRTDARYHGAAPADRARYIRDVRATAEAFGFSWALWNSPTAWVCWKTVPTIASTPAFSPRWV